MNTYHRNYYSINSVDYIYLYSSCGRCHPVWQV